MLVRRQNSDHSLKKESTPFLAVDLNTIIKRFELMQKGFPNAAIHFAVKANPHDVVLAKLAELGSNFDVASVQELDKVLALGVDPSRISYGNTIKRKRYSLQLTKKGCGCIARFRSGHPQPLPLRARQRRLCKNLG